MVDILGNTRNVISQIIRGDNRGRADLQRGGQARQGFAPQIPIKGSCAPLTGLNHFFGLLFIYDL